MTMPCLNGGLFQGRLFNCVTFKAHLANISESFMLSVKTHKIGRVSSGTDNMIIANGYSLNDLFSN